MRRRRWDCNRDGHAYALRLFADAADGLEDDACAVCGNARPADREPAAAGPR